ncbi:hypothetical protein EU520_01085 [Candidatus Thorarchaeota archaeon]|nr:MAG: hypothetical protein EU520_01085 [Candidatus Thorarchaeota archaeon]
MISQTRQAEVAAETVLSPVKTRAGLPVRVLRAESRHLPDNTYIIESAPAREVLLKPWIIGADLAEYARESSELFLRTAYALSPEMRDSALSSVFEVVPLAGALYYRIGRAFRNVFGETLNRCFVGASRRLTDTGWITDLEYKNFEALTSDGIIIIGDTVATGGTMERIIRTTLEQDFDPRALLVYSIAGGLAGAIRFKVLSDELDVPTYWFFSNAIFGVADSGTDMPWLHPATIVSSEVRRDAVEAYGEHLGRTWCSIWDWGERAKDPVKHLEALLKRVDSELPEAHDSKTKAVLTNVRAHALESLKRWREPLSLRLIHAGSSAAK